MKEMSHVSSIGVPGPPQIYRLAKATNTNPVSRLKIKLTTNKDYLPTSTTPIYRQKKIKMSPFKETFPSMQTANFDMNFFTEMTVFKATNSPTSPVE